MSPSQLYHIFQTTFPEMNESVTTYQQVRGNSKAIKLYLIDGTFGMFTYVDKNHYILEVYPR